MFFSKATIALSLSLLSMTLLARLLALGAHIGLYLLLLLFTFATAAGYYSRFVEDAAPRPCTLRGRRARRDHRVRGPADAVHLRRRVQHAPRRLRAPVAAAQIVANAIKKYVHPHRSEPN